MQKWGREWEEKWKRSKGKIEGKENKGTREIQGRDRKIEGKIERLKKGATVCT